MSAAARGAGGAIGSKVWRGCAPGSVLAEAIHLAQIEQDLIANQVLPDRAHFLARVQLAQQKDAA